MNGFDVNWCVVVLRLVDGFLYGTGFVIALLCWYVLFKKLGS